MSRSGSCATETAETASCARIVARVVKVPILGSDPDPDKVAESREAVYDQAGPRFPFPEDRSHLMNPVTRRADPVLDPASAVLLASLLGILWAWVWALRRIWTGRGLLENVRPSTLGEAPWGRSRFSRWFCSTCWSISPSPEATPRRLAGISRGEKTVEKRASQESRTRNSSRKTTGRNLRTERSYLP